MQSTSLYLIFSYFVLFCLCQPAQVIRENRALLVWSTGARHTVGVPRTVEGGGERRRWDTPHRHPAMVCLQGHGLDTVLGCRGVSHALGELMQARGRLAAPLQALELELEVPGWCGGRKGASNPAPRPPPASTQAALASWRQVPQKDSTETWGRVSPEPGWSSGGPPQHALPRLPSCGCHPKPEDSPSQAFAVASAFCRQQ